jgi:Tol biopolymer transport system component
MWQPDGRGFSVLTYSGFVLTASPRFWTVPSSGGPAIPWDIAPQVAKDFEQVSGSVPVVAGEDYSFAWAPSGKAVYFAREYKGAKNIWKMSVDRVTFRATAIERLTTGPGLDTEPALSTDGRRLAFAAKSVHTAVWVFPFDATVGRISGTGLAATSSGLEASVPSLSYDGTKLAFVTQRGDRNEIWVKSLVDGHQYPIIVDDYIREFPQWSRDGRLLFYRRIRIRSGIAEGQLVVWSEEGRREVPLTGWSTGWGAPYDWSADGKSLVASGWKDTGRAEVWQLPFDGTSNSEVRAQKILSHSSYHLWQPHYSPDDSWILFEAVDIQPKAQESIIYVRSKTGGPWVRITEENHWSDKPRWSLDGKAIYYVTDHDGFLNVSGIRFDPAIGKPFGKSFQVTSFNTPSLMFPSSIESADISIGRGKLALTLEQASGSIWVLDNIDR